MAFFGGVKLALALMLVFAVLDLESEARQNFIGRCWETWSRCTRWSSFATGILWQTCEERCKSLGYGRGDCVKVPSICPFTEKAWQCQCF
ncbi:neuromacin-like protein [Montipora foliosa]|uniref:neuromacin-like protein n=1 Tax=Montipora foliosa TaxID=591990 RepID=UPI0035F1BF27